MLRTTKGIHAADGGRGRWRGVAVVVVALFVWPFGGALSEARTSSALRVEASGAPQRVHGSDGREHIEYDLMITNAFVADATVTSLEVRGDGRRLLSLSGAALDAATLCLGTLTPTGGRIGPSSTVETEVDVVLPRSAGRRVPRLLSENEPFEIDRYTLEGTVGPETTLMRVSIIGRRRRERQSHPLINSVTTLLPPERPRVRSR